MGIRDFVACRIFSENGLLLVFTTVVFVSAPLLWAADEQLGQRVIVKCAQDSQQSGGCTRATSGEDCDMNNISKKCTAAGTMNGKLGCQCR
jgi:hypothetical protein